MNSLASNDKLCSVRAYWQGRVHDWKVAQSPVGSATFFQEVEAYRFRKVNYLLELLDWLTEDSSKLLDLGCGVGTELTYAVRQNPKLTVLGVDLTDTAVELATSNFRSRNLAGKFLVMNGESLDFQDAEFDSIFCHSTLQFTPNPYRMVQEIHRVLKPGGRAVVMVENRHSWLNVLRLLTRQTLDHEDAPVYHRHTLKEFETMVDMFSQAQVYADRFPISTQAHSGVMTLLFNKLFVPLFGLLPRRWVRDSGHHLIARLVK